MISNQDVTITLTVSAKRLYEIGETAATTDVDKLCLLSDDNDGKYDGSNKAVDFRSNVFKDDKVIWTGRSLDKGYNIRIDNYSRKDDTTSKVLDIDTRVPIGGGSNQRVAYTVLSGAVEAVVNDPGKEENYKVKFTIIHDSTEKEFTLDPKIRPNA